MYQSYDKCCGIAVFLLGIYKKAYQSHLISWKLKATLQPVEALSDIKQCLFRKDDNADHPVWPVLKIQRVALVIKLILKCSAF